MITSFEELLSLAKNKKKKVVSVINPIDYLSIQGALLAKEHQIVEPIFFGDKDKIRSSAEENNLDISNVEVIDCSSDEEASYKAVESCREGRSDILMKGKIKTGTLLKSVVNSTTGLRTNSHISGMFILSIPTYHKLLFITDASISIMPSIQQKENIIINALNYMKNLGYEKPKVGCLSSVEVVNPNIPSSCDAHELANMPELKERSHIEGPLAFDAIISKKSADIKGLKSDIAGDVDLIVAPNLDVGNSLFKSLVYLAKAEVAGVVLGAKVPIILTSRSDSAQSRLISLAFSL